MNVLNRIVDHRTRVTEVLVRFLSHLLKSGLVSGNSLEILVRRDGRGLSRDIDVGMRHVHTIVRQQVFDGDAECRTGHLEPQHGAIGFVALGDGGTDCER